MPVSNKKLKKPIPVAPVLPRSKGEFSMEFRKTVGPWDSIDIFCVGVRIGQVTLIHGEPARDFVVKMREAGVVVNIDKFMEVK